MQGLARKGGSHDICSGKHRFYGGGSAGGREGQVSRKALPHSQRRIDSGARGSGRIQARCGAYGRINPEAKRPAVFFVPLLGFSNHDSKQGHLYDPSLPPVFAEHLKKVMPQGVPIEVLPYHINDRPFAERIIEQVIAFQQASAKSSA